MNKAVFGILFGVAVLSGIKPASAVTDYVVNLIDTGTEYVNQVGQVQEEITTQMSEYMNIKIGIPGDAKMVQKAAEKAQRLKEKAEKYQAKIEKLNKQVAKVKEKAEAIKEQKEKIQGLADKIKEEYDKAQEKVNKVKEKVADAKEKFDDVKNKVKDTIEDAKQQYEDVKGQIDEVRDGISDIKEGVDAIKGAAEAKLGKLQDKIDPSGENETVYEENVADTSEETMEDSEEITEEENQSVPAQAKISGQQAALADSTPVNRTAARADTLSALNSALQQADMQPDIAAGASLPAAEVMSQMLTPEEVFNKAEQIDPEKALQAEPTSIYNLEEQLQMMDAAKAAEREQNRPQYISQEELEGQLKAEDMAKLEALRASRRTTSRKSFERMSVTPQIKAKAGVISQKSVVAAPATSSKALSSPKGETNAK